MLETDFFKFRGRGLIQTTWRNNYALLAQYVQGYQGNSKVLQTYSGRWASLAPDDVCTVSTNADWDALFSDQDGVLISYAVYRHAQTGKYLPLARTTEGINTAGLGSVVRLGDRLGGLGYGTNLKGRLADLCAHLMGMKN